MGGRPEPATPGDAQRISVSGWITVRIESRAQPTAGKPAPGATPICRGSGPDAAQLRRSPPPTPNVRTLEPEDSSLPSRLERIQQFVELRPESDQLSRERGAGSAAGRRRRPGGTRHRARRIANVPLRLFGAPRHRFTRLAVQVFAALSP